MSEEQLREIEAREKAAIARVDEYMDNATVSENQFARQACRDIIALTGGSTDLIAEVRRLQAERDELAHLLNPKSETGQENTVQENAGQENERINFTPRIDTFVTNWGISRFGLREVKQVLERYACGLFAEIDARAQNNMLKTGVVSGAHYNAMKQLAREVVPGRDLMEKGEGKS